jgi:hypothetical protein
MLSVASEFIRGVRIPPWSPAGVAPSPLSAVLGVCLLCLCVLVQKYICEIYILREPEKISLSTCLSASACLRENNTKRESCTTTKKLVPCAAKILRETIIFEIKNHVFRWTEWPSCQNGVSTIK